MDRFRFHMTEEVVGFAHTTRDHLVEGGICAVGRGMDPRDRRRCTKGTTMSKIRAIAVVCLVALSAALAGCSGCGGCDLGCDSSCYCNPCGE